MAYPKYEKADNHTIKVIVEKSQAVDLQKILDNKEQLIMNKAHIEKTLVDIEKVLEEAKKLGITPKPKVVEPKKEEKK